MISRIATEADLPALAEIHVAAWRAAYLGKMDPDFLKSLGPEHSHVRLRPALQQRPPLVVVVENQQAVVGFCRFGPSNEPDVAPHTGEVFAINVHPNHWRHGFGARVMTAALERLARCGFGTCNLWVLDSNDRARSFYSALGFALDGATRVEAEHSNYPLAEVRYSREISSFA